MEDELLTTAEAARQAGVGTTSVKRWADARRLPCVRTVGGHRRFRRTDLEVFLRELAAQSRGDASEPGTAQFWLRLMLHGGPFELQGQILCARDRLGSWARVAAELGEACTALGLGWERGDVSLVEEHMASEKLARALQRVTESLPESDQAPACLLAAAEGDEHTLGLSLVELCLREAGWTAIWAGRNVPLGDVATRVADGGVHMLALSASLHSSNRGLLAAQVERAAAACRAAQVRLVLGGAGAWPRAPAYGERFDGLELFTRKAAEWRRELR